MLPKLEPDVLNLGVGLGVGVGVGVGEDSMDAGGPPSVGSTEAQPVLSNTQTPVSTKKVGLAVSSYLPLSIFYSHCRMVFFLFVFIFIFFFYLEKYASIPLCFIFEHR